MDSITAQIYYALKEQEWRRKMINKPIEYVDKINPYSISSVRQRLKPFIPKENDKSYNSGR